MTRSRRGPKGTAYNYAVFNSTEIARAGGPVRLSLGSIDRNSSRSSLYKEAKARNWRVIQIGSTWLLFDTGLSFNAVCHVTNPGALLSPAKAA